MDVLIRSNSNITSDTANCRAFLQNVRISILILPFLCPNGKAESATREQAALLDLLGVVMPFVLFRAGNGSIFAGRNRDVMCADDLGASYTRIPACSDLHGLSRQGGGCGGFAFITALDRCSLAREEAAFLVFQAVVIRGFVVTIFQ